MHKLEMIARLKVPGSDLEAGQDVEVIICLVKSVLSSQTEIKPPQYCTGVVQQKFNSVTGVGS